MARPALSSVVFHCFVASALAVGTLSGLASAQDSSMSGMKMKMQIEDSDAGQLPSPHAGSGTGWQPVSVPQHEWMWMPGGWELKIGRAHV